MHTNLVKNLSSSLIITQKLGGGCLLWVSPSHSLQNVGARGVVRVLDVVGDAVVVGVVVVVVVVVDADAVAAAAVGV